MQTTANLGLKKPEGTDVVNVYDFNDNADIIDREMKKNAEGVARLERTRTVNLSAVGWSGSAPPYIQTVSVPGATAESEAILVSDLSDGASAATQRAYSKAFGIISSGTATLGDGTATFKVYKKPATDCVVGLKGV